MKHESTKSYYNERWRKEEKANLWAMSRASVILSELSLLGIHSPKMLDLGCGTGWMTDVLSQFGSAVGVDLAPGPAREAHPHLLFFGADEVPAGPFDVVISQEVIEHVNNQMVYVDAAYSALTPGGYLILTTPNAKVSLRHPEFLVQPIEKHLDRANLRRILEKKFEIKKLYSFFFGYARWRPYRMQMRFGRYLNAGLHLAAVCRRSSS